MPMCRLPVGPSRAVVEQELAARHDAVERARRPRFDLPAEHGGVELGGGLRIGRREVDEDQGVRICHAPQPSNRSQFGQMVRPSARRPSDHRPAGTIASVSAVESTDDVRADRPRDAQRPDPRATPPAHLHRRARAGSPHAVRASRCPSSSGSPARRSAKRSRVSSRWASSSAAATARSSPSDCPTSRSPTSTTTPRASSASSSRPAAPSSCRSSGFAAERADDDDRAEIAEVAQQLPARHRPRRVPPPRPPLPRHHRPGVRQPAARRGVRQGARPAVRVRRVRPPARPRPATAPRCAASSTPRPATTPRSPRRSPQATPTPPSAKAPATSMPSNVASSIASCKEQPDDHRHEPRRPVRPRRPRPAALLRRRPRLHDDRRR